MSRRPHFPTKTRPDRLREAGAESLAKHVIPAKSSKRKTILLIDDDAAVRNAIERVLVMEGWRVISASGGEAGLERLIESEPDLMITDLKMGDVNGWDLLFHETIQRPHLPIFIITALPARATGGADKLATRFFQKPLDFEAFLAAISGYLGPPIGVV